MNRHEPNPTTNREIIPPKKLSAKVSRVLAAKGRDFVSQPVDGLDLSYGGIEGDIHCGITRSSGAREPWYERGTEMRNERQLSILSEEELSVIADEMGLLKIEPGWIGANLVLEGVDNLTFLPPRTLLIFEGGVTLRIDGHNGPCRIAGGEIARHIGAARTGGGLGETMSGDVDWSRTDVALRFVEAARMRRGLVAWVEREGRIVPGEKVSIRIWEQWIY